MDIICTVLIGIASAVLGGMILAILFFLAKEKLFPLPAITGRWHFEMNTEETAYNPYTNISLQYAALLWREGPYIKGTTEKTYEHSSSGPREYIGVYRTRGRVEGYIEKKYFPGSKDIAYLHITEDGHCRESTHYHELQIDNNGQRMRGKFSSTAADSEGSATWQRTAFSPK